MWDDFQIGDRVRAHSAIAIQGYDISHNDLEYWWRYEEGDIGGRINKLSSVGETVTRMIKRRCDPSELEAFILENALSSMPASKIVTMLYRIRKKAFMEGQIDNQNKIKLHLGIK